MALVIIARDLLPRLDIGWTERFSAAFVTDP